MSQPVAYATQPPVRRFSKAAIGSLICGILGCVPFVTGALAVLLGIIGIFTGGKPGRRGRWMAVIGLLLGLFSLAAWTVAGGSMLAIVGIGSKVVAAMTAPADATRDFIRAADNGDEAGEKAHSAMSDDDRKAAETMVRAQGVNTNSTLNNVSIDEGGAGHVEGTMQFQSPEGPVKTLHVKADLTEVGGQWKVESVELLPE